MATLDRLDPSALATLLEEYRDALRSHREELNRLNVYPVPDGDTGTNMVLTVESVLQELEGTTTMAEVCEAIAHGSLMGARGNSGVILSQVLRGLAKGFSGLEAVRAAELADGLARASESAYEAVMRPVEGTILTVVRDAAEAATATCEGDAADLLTVLEAAKKAADDSLARTPDLLPVLAEAGVVDAGAKGFVLFVDTLLHVVDGRPVPEPELIEAPAAVRAHIEGEDDVSALRYEVMFFLEVDDEKVPYFKDAWRLVGDSIVVVGGDGIWNCHIHTDDVGAAIEAGIDAGRPRSIRVTDLAEQTEEESWVREHAGDLDEPRPPRERVETAVVTVAVGRGLQQLFTGLGAAEVVAGGQTMNPSTEQMLAAVEACPSDRVVVLPNNKNIVPVARQVDGLTDKQVEVVPTTSVVEGLTALIDYDPRAGIEANVAAITEGSQRVKTGEVTRAIRDALAPVGPIAEGDWIALDAEGVCAVERTAVDAAVALVEHLATEDDELVTVIVGADAVAAETEALEEALAVARPHLELELQHGDQPLYPYLIGVE